MRQLHNFLHQPLRVFILCVSFATVSLLLNGGFFQLYRLHRDQQTLTSQIKEGRLQVVELAEQLRMAKDPIFIERQALENYDLVDEHDLVFVFSEE